MNNLRKWCSCGRLDQEWIKGKIQGQPVLVCKFCNDELNNILRLNK